MILPFVHIAVGLAGLRAREAGCTRISQEELSCCTCRSQTGQLAEKTSDENYVQGEGG